MLTTLLANKISRTELIFPRLMLGHQNVLFCLCVYIFKMLFIQIIIVINIICAAKDFNFFN